MEQNQEKNIIRITSELHKICMAEIPEHSIKAIINALTMILVLHYKNKDVKQILIGFAKDVLNNYNKMFDEYKTLKEKINEK